MNLSLRYLYTEEPNLKSCTPRYNIHKMLVCPLYGIIICKAKVVNGDGYNQWILKVEDGWMSQLLANAGNVSQALVEIRSKEKAVVAGTVYAL